MLKKRLIGAIVLIGTILIVSLFAFQSNNKDERKIEKNNSSVQIVEDEQDLKGIQKQMEEKGLFPAETNVE